MLGVAGAHLALPSAVGTDLRSCTGSMSRTSWHSRYLSPGPQRSWMCLATLGFPRELWPFRSMFADVSLCRYPGAGDHQPRPVVVSTPLTSTAHLSRLWLCIGIITVKALVLFTDADACDATSRRYTAGIPSNLPTDKFYFGPNGEQEVGFWVSSGTMLTASWGPFLWALWAARVSLISLSLQ